MRLDATPEALEFVRERGGRLFVTRARGCCAPSVSWLQASTSPDTKRRFRRVQEVDDVEVYFPDGARLPEQLGLRLRRFPRRHVEAYWDGCAWVV